MRIRETSCSACSTATCWEASPGSKAYTCQGGQRPEVSTRQAGVVRAGRAGQGSAKQSRAGLVGLAEMLCTVWWCCADALLSTHQAASPAQPSPARAHLCSDRCPAEACQVHDSTRQSPSSIWHPLPSTSNCRGKGRPLLRINWNAQLTMCGTTRGAHSTGACMGSLAPGTHRLDLSIPNPTLNTPRALQAAAASIRSAAATAGPPAPQPPLHRCSPARQGAAPPSPASLQ